MENFEDHDINSTHNSSNESVDEEHCLTLYSFFVGTESDAENGQGSIDE